MKYNFKKRYGQNFLNNDNIPKKIAASISPKADDLIIEIGLGIGALTKELIKFNSNYLGYEIDLETRKYLNNIVNLNNVIYDDFLNRNIKEDIKNISYNNLFIVGNLPYYITTPIITKILNEDIKKHEIVFMVQEEVAKRLTSKNNSKEYGYITALLNCYYEISYLFKVTRNNFTPPPNVDSAIIKMIRKDKIDVDFESLNDFLKKAFEHKRKTLKNNLFNYDLNKIDEILRKYGLSINCRAEEIPYNIFIEIVKNL